MLNHGAQNILLFSRMLICVRRETCKKVSKPIKFIHSFQLYKKENKPKKKTKKHTALKCVIILSCLWMSVAVLSMLIPLLKSRSLDSSVRLDQIIYPSIYPLLLYCIFVYICSFIYVTICQPASLCRYAAQYGFTQNLCVCPHFSLNIMFVK